ncbi:MAG: hypothetical protein WBH66_06025, partial [Rectinemataceae bacterium]
MQILTLHPQPEGRHYLEFGFSSLPGLASPRAILSTADSGDRDLLILRACWLSAAISDDVRASRS